MGCWGTKLQDDLIATVDYTDHSDGIMVAQDGEGEPKRRHNSMLIGDFDDNKTNNTPWIRRSSAITRAELLKSSHDKSPILALEVDEKETKHKPETKHKRGRSESTMIIKRGHASSPSISVALIEDHRVKDISGKPPLSCLESETVSSTSAKDIDDLDTSDEDELKSREHMETEDDPQKKMHPKGRASIVLGLPAMNIVKEDKENESNGESKPISNPILTPNCEGLESPISTTTPASMQQRPKLVDIPSKEEFEDSYEEIMTNNEPALEITDEKNPFLSLTTSLKLIGYGGQDDMSQGEVVETSISTSSEMRIRALPTVDARRRLASRSRGRSNASCYLQIMASRPGNEDSAQYSLETSISSSVEMNLQQEAVASGGVK